MFYLRVYDSADHLFAGGDEGRSAVTEGRIILAGGSGFLGRILASHLRNQGREVVILTRTPAEKDDVFWDGRSVENWWEQLEGSRAVINLSGRSVNCRYTPENRRAIVESRVNSTRVIGEAIAKCRRPPPVWLNASTATIYKHTLGAAHGEDGAIGATEEARDEFSIEVARAWERSLEEADMPGTRKVALRAAMVLGKEKNSVFPTLRRLARLGLGGRMGSGKQYVSWIHERDFCRAVEWIIANEKFSGPVNIASPNAVTNGEMMRLLREVVGARFGLPATEWMLEIGAIVLRTEVELMIKSRRVAPKRLLESGFQFDFPTMREAFGELARKP